MCKCIINMLMRLKEIHKRIRSVCQLTLHKTCRVPDEQLWWNGMQSCQSTISFSILAPLPSQSLLLRIM